MLPLNPRPASEPAGRARGVPLVLLGVTALAGIVRFWGLGFGLPLTESRPDESTLAGIAMRIAGGDLHPHFFNYPTLYLYILAGLYRASYAIGAWLGWFVSFDQFAAYWTTETARAHLVSRAVSATLGTATVPMLYLLGRRVSSPRSAAAAALFLATAFLHVRDSHFGVTDVATTFLVVCAVHFLMKALQEDRFMDFALAGLLAGLASSTKYNAALLVVPMVVALVAARSGRPGDARRTVMRAVLLAVPFAIAFAATTPYALIDQARFWRDVNFEALHMQRGHGPNLGPGWLYHFSVSLALGLGWPLLCAGIVGLAIASWRCPVETAVLSAFPLAYYAVAGSGRVLFVRYMVPVVPFLCLAAGTFAVLVADGLARRLARPARTVVLTAVCGLVVLPSATRVIAFDRLLERRDSRLLAADWVEANVAPGASIYQTGSRYGELPLRGPIVPWTFDPVPRRFETPESPTDRLPDWIVVQRSPVTYYSQMPVGIEQILQSCYDLVESVRAMNDACPGAYDQQDAFFLPLAGFSSVTRPGPNIDIYRRREWARCQEPIREPLRPGNGVPLAMPGPPAEN